MNLTDFLPFIGNPNTNLWARADKAIVNWENQHLFTIPSSVVGTGVGAINPIAGMVVSKAGISGNKTKGPSKAHKKSTTILRNKRTKAKSGTFHTYHTAKRSSKRTN